MKSQTPRTDQAADYLDNNGYVETKFAARLERELNAATEKLERVRIIAEAKAGFRMMQVASPFREVLNIINSK